MIQNDKTTNHYYMLDSCAEQEYAKFSPQIILRADAKYRNCVKFYLKMIMGVNETVYLTTTKYELCSTDIGCQIEKKGVITSIEMNSGHPNVMEVSWH